MPLKHTLRDMTAGGTPDTSNPELWCDEGGVPWVAIGDMTKAAIVRETQKRVTKDAIRGKRLRVLPPGTLLYSMYASLGKVAELGISAVTNQAILGLFPDLRVAVPDFIRWWLVGFEPHLAFLSNGNTQDNLNAAKVRSIPVLLPPLDVQQHIAKFLDHKTAAIDELIHKKERLIELLQEKRQALITELLAKGLVSSRPTKTSGVDWIDEFPAHWRALPIKRLAASRGRTFTDGDWIESPFITSAGIRLIQTGNVGVGTYREQGFRYISQETFRELRCTEVLPGDILICRLDGPVGRACRAPNMGERMITSVDNAILKTGPEHDARFIVYVLSAPRYLDWVQSLCRVGGGFRFRISRSMLAEFRLPIPPSGEQRAIADLLDSRTAGIARTAGKLSLQIERLREYRQALITAGVTGKLEVA